MIALVRSERRKAIIEKHDNVRECRDRGAGWPTEGALMVRLSTRRLARTGSSLVEPSRVEPGLAEEHELRAACQAHGPELYRFVRGR